MSGTADFYNANSCEEIADSHGAPRFSIDDLQDELEEMHLTSTDLLLPCPAVSHPINGIFNMDIEEASHDD